MVNIKKTSDKGKYVFSGGWVRDFTSASGLIIPELYDDKSIKDAVSNEAINRTYNLPMIDREAISAFHVVIVSDGTDLSEVMPIINSITKHKTIVIGVNNSLANNEFYPNYYISNRQDDQSVSLIPKQRVLPTLIASCRANHLFVRRYRQRGGVVFVYVPTSSKKFSSNLFKSNFTVDDYRNPICSAINLAHKWGANKLTLFAPHDFYSENRPATQKIRDGIYIYPQQKIAHDYVDGCLYWLKENGCDITAVTSGPVFCNAKTLTPSTARELFR